MYDFDYSAHEKASGSAYIAQTTLQILIDDEETEDSERIYAMEIHKWLGEKKCEIDNVFHYSSNYGIFLLQTMQMYEITEGEYTRDYICALESLRDQYERHVDKEELIQRMALETITDVNYRGYD